MTKLDAFNQILAYVGEEPISDLTTPSYEVNIITPQFEYAKRSILLHGHSFNTDTLTLSPDVNNEIAVPSSVISLRFQAGKDSLTVRNGYVWDTDAAARETDEQTVLATQDIDFEQMPEAFQQWVTMSAAAAVRIRLNGVDTTAAFLRQEANRAKAVALNSEPANSTNITGWGAVVAAYGA